MDATRDPARLVAGVMTGTSIDGLDAAVVAVEGRGLAMRTALVRHVSRPLGDLVAPLRAAAAQTPMSAAAFARLARCFGELHGEAVAEAAAGARLGLIAVHGQTVFHAPPHSWQLIEPAPIARRFGCPVVTDLRQADLAAGGRGAPITPLADWVLFRDPDRRRAIVNLGGFCNVTVLPAAGSTDPLARIHGADVCACNHLLDGIARAALGAAFDEDGRCALSGAVHATLADTLRRRLASQSAGGSRSLGTGDEVFDWVAEHRDLLDGKDLAATAVAALAGCILDALAEAEYDEIVLAGGGARNRALAGALAPPDSRTPVVMSDDLGIPAGVREAAAIAVLGALCADGVPITLPQVTGCTVPAPIAGRWDGWRPARIE